jgi:TrmH family RNA methyltransferase
MVKPMKSPPVRMADAGGRRRPRDPSPGAVKRITSLANPIVKEIAGLALAKKRRAAGRFLAEGLKLVTDGVDSGWPIDVLVYSDEAADQPLVQRLAATCHAHGGAVASVTAPVLAKISRRDNPQTVLGVFRQRWLAAESIRPSANDIWIAIEHVRDPGNLGTIVRTADAVGAAGLVLIGDSVDPFSIEAVRATMGSIFHVAVTRATVAGFTALVGRWPGGVVGTHLAAEVDYRRVGYTHPLLLVMGGEQAGLSPQVAALCQTLVRIPMAGRTDSLNLAVATAVMLFEIARDRLRLDG